MDGVDAKVIRQRVIVGVAGLDDTGSQVDIAEPFVAVAAEFVIAKNPVARVIGGGLGRSLAKLKGGKAHKRLVG